MADKTLNDVQNPEDEQWVKLGWTKDTADQEFNNKCLPSSVGIDQESLIDGNNVCFVLLINTFIYFTYYVMVQKIHFFAMMHHVD